MINNQVSEMSEIYVKSTLGSKFAYGLQDVCERIRHVFYNYENYEDILQREKERYIINFYNEHIKNRS